MQQAEDYIKKQQEEHQRIARNDNFHQRGNDYQRRFQQNIHEEEIKIDPAAIGNSESGAGGQVGSREAVENPNPRGGANNHRDDDL
jgi:hypothetical protein